ncbi:MAG: flagellar hook-basal body complex protein FliE [Acidobacteriota bacterium]
MAEPIAAAIAAYANAGRIAAAPGIAARDGGGGFGDLVRQAAESAVGSVKQGEQTSLAGVMGKADIAQVAAAVANAETTLETVVAVRDRVIQAYQDIIKMPI